MVNATLTVGGEVDIASGAEVADHFSSLRGWLDNKTRPQYRVRRAFSGAVNNAPAGTNICYFGVSPPAGKEWYVKLVEANVNDDHTPPVTTSTSTPAVNSVPLGATGVATYNNNAVPVNITIAGGTVTAIVINGGNVGATSGTFTIPAFGNIAVTYSVTPTTFTTAAIGVPVSTPVTASLYCGDPYTPMLVQNKLAGLSLPMSRDFGDARVICHSTEYIFVIFYNVTASSLLWANVEVDEVMTKHVEAMAI